MRVTQGGVGGRREGTEGASLKISLCSLLQFICESCPCVSHLVFLFHSVKPVAAHSVKRMPRRQVDPITQGSALATAGFFIFFWLSLLHAGGAGWIQCLQMFRSTGRCWLQGM